MKKVFFPAQGVFSLLQNQVFYLDITKLVLSKFQMLYVPLAFL